MVAQGEASASRAQPWERVPITRSPEGRQSLRRNAVAEDPVEALEELLEAGVEDRVQWWVSRDFVGADGDEIEAARVQCLSVYEKTIAPIVGARVSIMSPERVTISSDAGTYLLRDVPAGSYKVFTSAIGRKPYRRSDSGCAASGPARSTGRASSSGTPRFRIWQCRY